MLGEILYVIMEVGKMVCTSVGYVLAFDITWPDQKVTAQNG